MQLVLAWLMIALAAQTARGGFELLPMDGVPVPLLPLHLPAPFGGVLQPAAFGMDAGFLHLRPYGMDDLRFDAVGLGWNLWGVAQQTYLTRLGTDGYQELEFGARLHRRNGPGLLVRALGTFPDHELESDRGVTPLRGLTLTPVFSGSAGRRLLWSISWRDALGRGDSAALGLTPSPALRIDLDLGQGWGIVWAGSWSSVDPGRDQSRIAITWASGSRFRIGQDWSSGLNASWVQAGVGAVQGLAWGSQSPGGPATTTGFCVAVSRPGTGPAFAPQLTETAGAPQMSPGADQLMEEEIPEWMEDGLLLDGVALLAFSEADSLGAWGDSLAACLSAFDDSPLVELQPGASSVVQPSIRNARLGWQDTRRRSSTGRWSVTQRVDGSMSAGPGAFRFALRRHQGAAVARENGWASAACGNWRVTAGVGGHPLRWGLGLLARSRVVSIRRGAAAALDDPREATLPSISRPTEMLSPVLVGTRRHLAVSYRSRGRIGFAYALSDDLVQAALERSGDRLACGVLAESRDGVRAAGIHLTHANGPGLVQTEFAVREGEGLLGGLRFSAVADRGQSGRYWWDLLGRQHLLTPPAGEGAHRLRERGLRPSLSVRIGGSRSGTGGAFSWTRAGPPAAAPASRSESRSWSASLTARPSGMGAWSARVHGASRTYTCPGLKDDPMAPVPCRRTRSLRTQMSMQTDPNWERRGRSSWGFELGSDMELRRTCGGLVRPQTGWWSGVFRRHAIRGPRSLLASGSIGLLHADSGSATSVQVSPVWVGGPRRYLRGRGLWLGAGLKLRSRMLSWRLDGVVPVGVGDVLAGEEGGGVETRLELRTL